MDSKAKVQIGNSSRGIVPMPQSGSSVRSQYGLRCIAGSFGNLGAITGLNERKAKHPDAYCIQIKKGVNL